MTDRVTSASHRLFPTFRRAGGARSSEAAAETSGGRDVAVAPIAATDGDGRGGAGGADPQRPEQSEAAFRAATEEAPRKAARPAPNDVLSLALRVACGGSGRIVSPGVERALSAPSPSGDPKLMDAVVDMASRGYQSLTGRASALKSHHDRRA